MHKYMPDNMLTGKKNVFFFLSFQILIEQKLNRAGCQAYTSRMRYQSLFWHNCLMKQVNKLKWIDVNIFPTVRSIQRSPSAFASPETDRNNKWGLWRQVTKRRSKKLQCSTLLSLCIWVQGCFLDEVWYSFVLSLTNRPQSWHSIAYFWLCSTLFFFMQAAREEAFLWNRQKPNISSGK